VSHRERFLAYLSHYAARQLEPIAQMLAEDASLRDWQIAVQGKAAVLRETARNFGAASAIEIEVLAVHESADAVAGELRVLVDREIELHVVDILRFGPGGLITSIRAFLGRGDAPPG
jgi:hypothetical protein